jgi:hypothetical protein
MKSPSVICRAFALVLAAVSLGSCSSSHMQAGTDGVTHWLRDCDTSAECGEMQCLCGVCTRSCEEDDACSDLGARAECASTDIDGCSLDTKVCQRDEPPRAGSGGGGGGSGGRDAATEAGSGGDVTPAVDGGQRDAAGPDASASELCDPMDARSSGALCPALLGYRWNGNACEEVLCTCLGDDCDALYATETECKVAHVVCLGVTSCSEPSHCELAPAACCACSDLGPGEVVAVASARRNDYEAQTCGAVDCVACEFDPLANTHVRVAAACNIAPDAQAGECDVVDLTRLPCTEEVGCRPRVARCCECGATPTVDELFATPIDYDVSSMFCDPTVDCCTADPIYPDDVEARCVNAVCELFEDGVLVPR